jgi:hypothetical protein
MPEWEITLFESEKNGVPHTLHLKFAVVDDHDVFKVVISLYESGHIINGKLKPFPYIGKSSLIPDNAFGDEISHRLACRCNAVSAGKIPRRTLQPFSILWRKSPCSYSPSSICMPSARRLINSIIIDSAVKDKYPSLTPAIIPLILPPLCRTIFLAKENKLLWIVNTYAGSPWRSSWDSP